MIESGENFIIKHENSSLQEASDALRARDAAIVELCADRLADRGHHHAANSLRKMLREGKLLP